MPPLCINKYNYISMEDYVNEITLSNHKVENILAICLAKVRDKNIFSFWWDKKEKRNIECVKKSL